MKSVREFARFVALVSVLLSGATMLGCGVREASAPEPSQTAKSLNRDVNSVDCSRQEVPSPECSSGGSVLEPVAYENMAPMPAVLYAAASGGDCTNIYGRVRGRVRIGGIEHGFWLQPPHILTGRLPPMPAFPGELHGEWTSLGMTETDNGGWSLEGEWEGVCNPIWGPLPMVKITFIAWLGTVYRRRDWDGSGGGGGQDDFDPSALERSADSEYICFTFEGEGGVVLGTECIPAGEVSSLSGSMDSIRAFRESANASGVGLTSVPERLVLSGNEATDAKLVVIAAVEGIDDSVAAVIKTRVGKAGWVVISLPQSRLDILSLRRAIAAVTAARSQRPREFLRGMTISLRTSRGLPYMDDGSMSYREAAVLRTLRRSKARRIEGMGLARATRIPVRY